MRPTEPTEHKVPNKFVISVLAYKHKLSKLEVYKAVGTDNIPNCILRDFSITLAPPIAAIINNSVLQGSTTHALMKPVHSVLQGSTTRHSHEACTLCATGFHHTTLS